MNNVSKSNRTERRDMAAFSKSYLLCYNSLQTVGWSYVLFQTIQFLLKNKSVVGLWRLCGTGLTVFQTLAFLEVLHCIFGLVPANPLVTFVQVASRVIQVWGYMIPIEKVQNSHTLAVTFLAWGITEVVRYSFYTANLLDKPPKFLTWCRYSLFMLLYPAGVYGEVSNILLSLDIIRNKHLFSFSLPNPLNISFSFYYATLLILMAYIPIFPRLFLHMLHQRKKVLGDNSAKKK